MILQAFDLGLNCDSSKWKMHGQDLFSEEETQVRRQIWWACVISDRYLLSHLFFHQFLMVFNGSYGSMYMGQQ